MTLSIYHRIRNNIRVLKQTVGLSLKTDDQYELQYLELNVLVGAHESKRVDETELDDRRHEYADCDDTEQTTEEDHHAELETPERYEFLQAEQHAADWRSECHSKPSRSTGRHEVPPAARSVSSQQITFYYQTVNQSINQPFYLLHKTYQSPIKFAETKFA